MPIRILDPTIYECFACGNTWTDDQYQSEVAAEFYDDAPDSDWCPSCGGESPICKVGSEEWNYHISCMDAARSERQIANAYPALFDKKLYKEEMRDAGRSRLLEVE